MRLLLDPKNEELADILNTLLTDKLDITAREVARVWGWSRAGGPRTGPCSDSWVT